MKNKLLSAFATIALGALAATALHAQEVSQTVTSETFEKWALSCTIGAEATGCQMVQTLRNSENGREVIRLSIVGNTQEQNSDRILRIRAPLRVLLAQGIRLTAASINVALPYNVCDSQGCYATLPIDTATVRAFQAAETGSLVFTFPGLEEPITATMSFEGFGAALGALQQKVG